MKTREELKKLFKKVDPEKDTVLALHINGDNNDGTMNTHFVGDMELIAPAIATILNEGFDVDADDAQNALAKQIIDGILLVTHKPSISSIQILTRFRKGVKDSINSIGKVGEKFDIDVDEDDEDDDENCETCENVKWCPLPNAVKYRKENNMPTRKKRMTDKKRCEKKGYKKN